MANMRDFSLIISLFFFFFLKGHFMFSADTIYSNQSFSGYKTIIFSAGGNFKLKIFKSGISSYNSMSNYYLGILYYKLDEDVSSVVWVANREKPISDIESAVLKILDGNLVLLNELKEPVWSTNVFVHSSSASNNLVAVLRDDGNLVLKDLSDSETKSTLWQSFDHPGNIWLPGAKISFNKRTNTSRMLTSWASVEDPAPGLFSLELDQNGSQLFTTFNMSRKYWTSGSWGAHMFSLGNESNKVYNFRYVDNENESYFVYSLHNPSTLSMFKILDYGKLENYIWMKETKGWDLISSQPRQCGNNTNGNLERDVFKRIYNIFIEQSPISTSYRSRDCEYICLRNCFCTAYDWGRGGCLIWNDEQLIMRQPLSGENGRYIYIRVPASKYTTKYTRTNMAAVIASIVVVLFFLVVLPVIIYKQRKKIIKTAETVAAFLYRYLLIAKKKVLDKLEGRYFVPVFLGKLHRSRDYESGFSEIPIFSFQIIQAATDNFSAANKLGEGGFGPVFKGTLPNGQDIAVKRLSRTSGQGVEEFKNEVTLISKVQHWNLVKLLGFCIQGDDRMLVYEYMPNKSLDSFIFGPASMEKSVLDWDLRNKIIEGIARGLLYLHRDSRLKIIHRDLKASNILLDEHMNPRISDFGMARIVMIEQSVANTNRVVGTYGYMSPEYAMQGIFSVKSDVFSFGVLLLEIVSGKRNTDFYDYENPQTLLGYAWQLWNEEKILDLLDLNLANSSNTRQVHRCIHVALLCVQEHVNDRPTMPEVVFMLCNDTILATPKKPAFCWTARPDGSTPWAPPRTFVGSRNEISNSSVYGR